MRKRQKLLCFFLVIPMFVFLFACTSENELGIREKKNKDMVKLNFGPVIISYSLSNGITLTGEEGSEFVCTTSSQDPEKEGVFLLDTLSDGNPSVTVASGTTIYWFCNPFAVSEVTWLEFINQKDSQIIGYAVVRVETNADQGFYKPEVVKAVAFPKVGGKYQAITDEQVNQLIKNAEK